MEQLTEAGEPVKSADDQKVASMAFSA